MNDQLKKTRADDEIEQCLNESASFYVIAGAGSGKTTSLITALDLIRRKFGRQLRRDSQQVVCLTYTKRAVDVISRRLGFDELYVVSTLHSFLWGEIGRFKTDVRRALQDVVLPARIAKKKEEDNGGNSKSALDARARVAELERQLTNLGAVPKLSYVDSNYSDYSSGELGHEDIVDIASIIITNSEQMRRIVGQKYPYIFVDEAQDTHENIVAALNSVCQQAGLPLVGYFGDPLQQIYDKRAGDFKGPVGSKRIPKEENFRSSRAVIDLLNSFRKDIQQFPGGPNAQVPGSVIIRLVQTERPAGERGRYTQAQIDRASKRLDSAMEEWGWVGKTGVKHLYLVRQMIARRLGFSNLHKLFTGDFASSKAQDDYENGSHFLLKPFIDSLYPIVRASRIKDKRATMNILRWNSPAFDPTGMNANRTLGEMLKRAERSTNELSDRWKSESLGDVLRFGKAQNLFAVSKRLSENLERARRTETYVEDMHSKDRSDWLADAYFDMKTDEVERYCEFIYDNTEFSTQHGVKGEQYESVLVVFDDTGSAWNHYNFSRTLTPKADGRAATERQLRLSTNLAYVCFSRAERDLRIVMFSPNADAAKKELMDRNYFSEAQIEVAALDS